MKNKVTGKFRWLLSGTLFLLMGLTIASSSGPSIVFDYQIYNFGTIKKNSDGTCLFPFSNQGDAPLVVSGVKASCGCTVPSYPKAPVLPGQHETIKVVYNTKTVGTFTKTINVTTNDAASLVVILTIKGTVVK
jgi:hypothetical protein